jgi:hypothetical protein
MIFVINDLKYDTDKMEKISDKVKKSYKCDSIFINNYSYVFHCALWRSKKGRWLLTHDNSGISRGEAIDAIEAKELLKKYDLDAYEKLFEELEEA